MLYFILSLIFFILIVENETHQKKLRGPWQYMHGPFCSEYLIEICLKDGPKAHRAVDSFVVKNG